MKAADVVQIAENIRVAVREKVELITGWYEGDGREHERLEEACGQWAMAEERERVLREEVKKANLWLAHRQQVIDNFFATLIPEQRTAAPEQGKEAKS